MSNRRAQRSRGGACDEAGTLGDLGPVDTAEITANALCTCWPELRESAS